jgi:hypothetical protein
VLFPLGKNGLVLDHVSHGGQLGAPYSQQDCSTVLADPCIRGQWQHNRHYIGSGNPRDVFAADFHTAGTNGTASHPLFDTLLCACLGCCNPDFANIKQPAGNFTGWANLKFQLCNPDDHKVCGPLPRPAPANALIFSGIGTVQPVTDSGPQKVANWVVYRVYVEDRSEPGGFLPGGAISPADVYCFQAWDTGIPVTKKTDPNSLGSAQGTSCIGNINAFRSLLSLDSCAFIQGISVGGPCPPGSLPSSIVGSCPATVNDCGALRSGNQQIHPSTAATCTVLGGGLPAPPATLDSTVCAAPATCTPPAPAFQSQ